MRILIVLALTEIAAFVRAADTPDADSVLKALGSPVVSERIAAGRALRGVTNPPASAADALVAALADTYFDVRAGAADALSRIGAPAVPHMGRALSSTNYHQRFGAARVLGRIGPAAAPALPDLGRALGDEAMDVRREAAQAIMNIGQPEKVAKDLVKAIGDKTAAVRELAAQALGKAGKSVLPDLIALLQGKDADAADAAAGAIEPMGVEAAEATPALMVIFRRDIESLRPQTTNVTADARRRLVVSWMAERPSHRALAKMGAAASPHLLEILKSGDSLAFQCACDVIAKMGREHAPAVPVLTNTLSVSKDFGERDASVWALAAAAPDSPEVISLFRDNLCGGNPPLLHASAHCLGKVKAARPLAEVVKEGTPEGRGLAKRFLLQLGKDARDAIPVLKEAAGDTNVTVKATAEEILKAIEGK